MNLQRTRHNLRQFHALIQGVSRHIERIGVASTAKVAHASMVRPDNIVARIDETIDNVRAALDLAQIVNAFSITDAGQFRIATITGIEAIGFKVATSNVST
jgi:hypothetical protein